MKTNIPEVLRFFGPVSPVEASQIADDMLNSDKIAKLFTEFLDGTIEPRELAYALQGLAEDVELIRAGKGGV